MKKLQNNFTTVEQSKRLLELGVPLDSADCYLTRFGIDEEWEIKVLNNIKYSELEIGNQDYCLPCWSVGRLREIFCICSSVNGTREYPFCNSQVDWWITEFEFKKEFIDFSKLED